MDEKTLMQYLEEINNCKIAIHDALVKKHVNMEGVKFEGYAEKIDELQLNTTPPDDGSELPDDGSSDSTPAPTPTADYIYSNGYVEGGNPDIMTYVPYEINLSEDNKFVIELFAPIEIGGWDGVYPDVVLGVDVPEKYELLYIKVYDSIDGVYIIPAGSNTGFNDNIRYKTIVRDGVIYNSYLRYTSKYYESPDLKGDPIVITNPYKYEITIQLK